MNEDYLKESAKEYVNKYSVRLSDFLNEYEAEESDFRKREIEYFENTLYDLENAEGAIDGYSITGITNFMLASKVCNEIGYEKFMYSTKKKINFLESKQTLPPQQSETKTDKLKVPQIALIHVYEGLQITRENAGEIAAKHGYTAKNSGEGLFQDYTNYCSTANRKGKPTPCTPKKLKNKIELFESVVNHLSDNNKQRAIDEIQILKTIFENEYQ